MPSLPPFPIKVYSLRARDRFIQPIFTKGLTTLVCKSDKMD